MKFYKRSYNLFYVTFYIETIKRDLNVGVKFRCIDILNGTTFIQQHKRQLREQDDAEKIYSLLLTQLRQSLCQSLLEFPSL